MFLKNRCHTSSCHTVSKTNGSVSKPAILIKLSTVFFLLLTVCFQVHARTPMYEDVGGIVRNAVTKEPIAGVTIIVKGTMNATRSNSKGEFNVRGIEVGAVLVFSYVGLEDYEVKVIDPNQPLNILMSVSEKG